MSTTIFPEASTAPDLEDGPRTAQGIPWSEFCGGPIGLDDCRACATERAAMLLTGDEPPECPTCGARRQLNVDGEVVHARLGTYECSKEIVVGTLRITASVTVEGEIEGMYCSLLATQVIEAEITAVVPLETEPAPAPSPVPSTWDTSDWKSYLDGDDEDGSADDDWKSYLDNFADADIEDDDFDFVPMNDYPRKSRLSRFFTNRMDDLIEVTWWVRDKLRI